jgi:invasion protein IalB
MNNSALPVIVRMVMAIVGTSTFANIGLAQEVALRSSFGNWSIYCLKDAPDPQPVDCSLVTAVAAQDNPNAWVKIGIAFSSPEELEMTIRTPRLNYFRRGIVITSDSGPVGRAFIEKCEESFCLTTVAVDARILQGLTSTKSLTFEYQINENEGIVIAVDAEQFSTALVELNKVVFPLLVADVEQGWKFLVELRKNPNFGSSVYTWGARYPDCNGSPSHEIVKVSNLKIENDRQLEEWLYNVQQCQESVVWVTGETQGALGEASKYQVFLKIKDKMRNVVTTDTSGQPLEFPYIYGAAR